MILIDLFLALNAVLLSIYVAYNLIFVVGYPFLRRAFPRKENHYDLTTRCSRFAIIVPAHNEELIIDRMIQSTRKLNYPEDKFELIVIADNCTDGTEEILRAGGVHCLVRHDQENRGKPRALAWGFKQIDIDDFDAFTIIDADTELDPDYLAALNVRVNAGQPVIQGYFGIMNPDETWLTRLMVIPGIIKFKTRYFCKDKLGISCPLMGNGMCFSKAVIQKYGWNTYSITENWEYYLQLLRHGYIVTFCEGARIYSHAVKKLDHGVTQRKRWQKGRLLLLKKHFFPLLAQGIKSRKLNFLDALMELSSPSYSMLMNWTVLYLLAGILISWAAHAVSFHLITAAMLMAGQVLVFMIGLLIGRASWRTWLSIFYVPVFLVWKIGITAMTFRNIKGSDWEKTERKL